jgi:hypothetical protein
VYHPELREKTTVTDKTVKSYRMEMKTHRNYCAIDDISVFSSRFYYSTGIIQREIDTTFPIIDMEMEAYREMIGLSGSIL